MRRLASTERHFIIVVISRLAHTERSSYDDNLRNSVNHLCRTISRAGRTETVV